jgi:hypothetical protein
MAIKQVIKFNSDNEYFVGFLQNIIDESEIEGGVTQKDREIILTIADSDTKKLEKFSELTNRYLPHSLFLGDIQTTQEDVEIHSTEFKSKTYDIGLCPKCLELLSDPASDEYLNDDLKCTHYCNEVGYYNDTTFFTPHYTSGCTVLLSDSSKIDELFIMTAGEKEALFSIEKPTIKVTIQDEELKGLCGKNYINIKSPYNVRSTLAALNAKDSEIPYLFFQNHHDLDLVKVQQNSTIIRASRVAQILENFNDDTGLNRFLNIVQEAHFNGSSVAANMSIKSGISFMLHQDDKSTYLLKFQPFNLKEMLAIMKENEIQSKLLGNFAEQFSSAMSELQQQEGYDVFETICTILELNERSFEALSDKSLEFRGNGGLKIDMFFKAEGFDYEAFIGSVMSFKLAGVEEHYLAYSIFEAFGDMIISTLNQLKIKHKTEHFVMMGDMFENAVLYSRILSKFQMSNPYFPKAIALDD